MAQIEKAEDSKEALKKQRDDLITARDAVQKEKTQALMNLELQQITAIEQQISDITYIIHGDAVKMAESHIVTVF